MKLLSRPAARFVQLLFDQFIFGRKFRGVHEEIRGLLSQVQSDLFSLGASLATPGAEEGTARPSIPPLPEERIALMEAWIDRAMEETPELHGFILPGGTRGAAAIHLARTVCRRAERAVVGLNQTESSDPGVLKYLNRLSDLLFALARLENSRQGEPEVLWEKEEG